MEIRGRNHDGGDTIVHSEEDVTWDGMGGGGGYVILCNA